MASQPPIAVSCSPVEHSESKPKDLESGIAASDNCETGQTDKNLPPDAAKNEENATSVIEENLEVWWDEPADEDLQDSQQQRV